MFFRNSLESPVMADDSLAELLEQLRLEGSLESQGQFSLSAEKLREKLAAFQFERPSQWMLKVIQALVVAKAASCDILQSYNRTLFYIQSTHCLFRPEELNESFYDPSVEASSAVRHLTMALWYLSFNLQLAWIWRGRQSEVGLMWTGTELQTVAIELVEASSLEVFHIQRKSENRWWSDILSDLRLQGPSGCAETSRELTLNAYTCPFPLSLDGRRIDNLLECSSITKAKHLDRSTLSAGGGVVCVAALGWGKADAAVVDMPPGTFTDTSSNELVQRSCLMEYPSDASWISLLLANLHIRPGGKSGKLEPVSAPSRVTWIRHGVVVAESDHPTDSAASCHLFVSADDRRVELSGLRLIEGETDLKPPILAAVADWLDQQSISFSPARQSQVKIANVYTTLFAIFQGNALLDASMDLDSGRMVFAGISFLGMAAFARFMVFIKDDSKGLEAAFELELKKLCQEWRQ